MSPRANAREWDPYRPLSGWEPSYLPPGYVLRRRNVAGEIGGLGGIQDQLCLLYTASWDEQDWLYPLLIYAGPPHAPSLLGTEHQNGEKLRLEISGVSTAYHDGIWMPGPGEDERTGHVAGRGVNPAVWSGH